MQPPSLRIEQSALEIIDKSEAENILKEASGTQPTPHEVREFQRKFAEQTARIVRPSVGHANRRGRKVTGEDIGKAAEQLSGIGHSPPYYDIPEPPGIPVESPKQKVEQLVRDAITKSEVEKLLSNLGHSTEKGVKALRENLVKLAIDLAKRGIGDVKPVKGPAIQGIIGPGQPGGGIGGGIGGIGSGGGGGGSNTGGGGGGGSNTGGGGGGGSNTGGGSGVQERIKRAALESFANRCETSHQQVRSTPTTTEEKVTCATFNRADLKIWEWTVTFRWEHDDEKVKDVKIRDRFRGMNGGDLFWSKSNMQKSVDKSAGGSEFNARVDATMQTGSIDPIIGGITVPISQTLNPFVEVTGYADGGFAVQSKWRRADKPKDEHGNPIDDVINWAQGFI